MEGLKKISEGGQRYKTQQSNPLSKVVVGVARVSFPGHFDSLWSEATTVQCC
jgi:hypothetical protein